MAEHEGREPTLLISVTKYRVPRGKGLAFLDAFEQRHQPRYVPDGSRAEHPERHQVLAHGDRPRWGLAMAMEDADFVAVGVWSSFAVLEAAPVSAARYGERGWGFRLPPVWQLQSAKGQESTAKHRLTTAELEQARRRGFAIVPGTSGQGWSWDVGAALPCSALRMRRDTESEPRLESHSAVRPWWAIVHLGLSRIARKLPPDQLLRALIRTATLLPEDGHSEDGPPPQVRAVPVLGLDPRAELAVLLKASDLPTLLTAAERLRNWQLPKELVPRPRPSSVRSRTIIGLAVGRSRCSGALEEPPPDHVLPLSQGDRNGWAFIGDNRRQRKPTARGYRLQTSLSVPEGRRGREATQHLRSDLDRLLTDLEIQSPRPVTVTRHIGYRDFVYDMDISEVPHAVLGHLLSFFAGLHPRHPPRSNEVWESTETSLAITIEEYGSPADDTPPTRTVPQRWPEPDLGNSALTVDANCDEEAQEELTTAEHASVALHGPIRHISGEHGAHLGMEAGARRDVNAVMDALHRSELALPALAELLPAVQLLNTSVQSSVAERLRRTHRVHLSPSELAHWIEAVRLRMQEQTDGPDPLVPTRRAHRGPTQPVGPSLPRLALSRYLQATFLAVAPTVYPLVRWTVDIGPGSSALRTDPTSPPRGVVLCCPRRFWWTPLQWPMAAMSVTDAIFQHWTGAQLERQIHQDHRGTAHDRLLDAATGFRRALDSLDHRPGDSIAGAISRAARRISRAVRPHDSSLIDPDVLRTTLEDLVRLAFTTGLTGLSTDPRRLWWAAGPALAHEGRWTGNRLQIRLPKQDSHKAYAPLLQRLWTIGLLEQIVCPGASEVDDWPVTDEIDAPVLPTDVDADFRPVISPMMLWRIVDNASAQCDRATRPEGSPGRRGALARLLGSFRLNGEQRRAIAGLRFQLFYRPITAIEKGHQGEPDTWQALVDLASAAHYLGRHSYRHACAQAAHRGDELPMVIQMIEHLHSKLRPPPPVELADNAEEENPTVHRLIPPPRYGLDGRILLRGGPPEVVRERRELYHSAAVALMAELGQRHIHAPFGAARDEPVGERRER